MNFYDNQAALKLHIENEIKTYQELITDLKNIIPAIKLFDGKCYNKRVLEEAKKHCTACNLFASSTGRKELEGWRLRQTNRGYQGSALSHWIYPDHDTEYISVLGDTESKRINAADTVAHIEKLIDDLKNDIAAMQAFDVDASYTQYTALLSQIDTFNKILPGVANDTLYIRIRR